MDPCSQGRADYLVDFGHRNRMKGHYHVATLVTLKSNRERDAYSTDAQHISLNWQITAHIVVDR